MEAVLIALGAIFGIVAVVVIGSIIRGYVFSVMWEWFVVPVFGLPVLGIAMSIGLSMIVSFLTYQHHNRESKTSGTGAVANVITMSVVYPFLVLGIAWIVKQFI